MSANPFGGFIHRSPLSSLPHDPPVDLASNCIRDFFGPTVQTVADCLQSRGPSTLSQIVKKIQSTCQRETNEERERLVDRLLPAGRTNGHRNAIGSGYRFKINKAIGPEQAGYVVDPAPVHAALIVLLQHSLVSVHLPSRPSGGPSKITHYIYSFLPERARLLPRYPLYIEHVRKNIGEDGDLAAAVVQEVLVKGRMRAEDLVARTLSVVKEQRGSVQDDSDAGGGEEGSENGLSDAQIDELREGVVSAFGSLVEEGFLEIVPPLREPGANEAEDDEREFVGADEEVPIVPPGRKRKRSLSGSTSESSKNAKKASKGEVYLDDGDGTPPGTDPDDPAIVALIAGRENCACFPPGAVWRVNVSMFHDSLRAKCLGRLCHERHGDRVQSSGSVTTAALKLMAKREHGYKEKVLENDHGTWEWEDKLSFFPDEILNFIAEPLKVRMRNKVGGASTNISKDLISLLGIESPSAVREVEPTEGHPRGGKFEINVKELLEYLRTRVQTQMILDSHGEIAARIVSILSSKGHLESDAIADAAMIPAKDVREILHRLYRENYISLFALQQTKQYNPSSAFYLWYVNKARLRQTVTANVCKALLNLRLRRQHELEVGNEWVERAKEPLRDENEHELDRQNYHNFLQGLERLDNAILQLDDTLMVLRDF